MSQIHGFMIDSARCQENRAYYKRLINYCADCGLNALLWHFTDDQGCSLDFPHVPGLGNPHAYSADEMRELVRYAETQGITLIPELETLGHSRYITRHTQYRHLLESDADFTAICPLHPETRALMRTLLQDVADIFPSQYIHVGLDEVQFGGHPLTAEALTTRSPVELFAEYARFLHKEIRDLGRKMIMWVDKPSFDTGLLDHLPTDITIAIWQYTPDVSDELARAVLKKGFKVLLCPGLITYDQQAFPGDFALPNIARMSSYQSLGGNSEVIGAMTTIWTPMRYLHDCLWPALRIAANTMTQTNTSRAHSLSEHMECFHGTTPSTTLLKSLCHCFDLAPQRAEYLAILKGEPLDMPIETIDARAQDWAAIADTLDSSRPQIHREQRAYETLHQFTAWMAYLYRRAAAISGTDATSTEHETLISEGHDWLQRLDAIWDQERFADDSRKHTPVFPWESNEYLLINFRQSIEAHATRNEIAALSTH